MVARSSRSVSMGSATWNEVRARRLARCALVDRARADRLVEVAREICGVHAQVQASAELQFAARVDGITQADVRNALWERRALVKAWTVRGTLHVHPADELALWFAARRAVTEPCLASSEGLEAWRDPAGVLHPALGDKEVKATRAAVRDALDGQAPMFREEIAAEVVKHVGPGSRQRLLSGFAFFFDELCQGPPQGAKITLVRPDQWIDGWQEVEEKGALCEVLRRFLGTYGPARPADFREWFAGRAFTPARARALFDSLGDELEEIEVEGHRAYTLAGGEREHLVPEAVRDQLAAYPRGRYEGPAGVRFVVIDGVPAGLWERKKRGKRLELRIAPSRRLTRAERAELDAETERFGAFLGLEPAITVA